MHSPGGTNAYGVPSDAVSIASVPPNSSPVASPDRSVDSPGGFSSTPVSP